MTATAHDVHADLDVPAEPDRASSADLDVPAEPDRDASADHDVRLPAEPDPRAPAPSESDASTPEPPVPVEVTVVETDHGDVWELAPDPMDVASKVLLREVAAWAAEWAPGGRARLVVDVPPPIAIASGFLDPDGARMLPLVAREVPSDELAEEMLALWHAVVGAGGAVGFRREADPREIRPTLDRHLSAASSGTSVLVTTRDPREQTLLGFGWWTLNDNPLFAHIALLKRFQVRPQAQGRNIGRVQMAGMHRIARGLPGLELCELAYCSGTGVSRFYDKCEYVEVGRRPSAVRVAPGDDRDSVQMMRRLDGDELRYDGRG